MKQKALSFGENTFHTDEIPINNYEVDIKK